MKLRASLARRESRGTHFRTDIPYRDDENFLCYIIIQKSEDGDMTTKKVDIPSDWAGDTTLPYENRYLYYFPGEAEAKGSTPSNSHWSGKRG